MEISGVCGKYTVPSRHTLKGKKASHFLLLCTIAKTEMQREAHSDLGFTVKEGGVVSPGNAVPKLKAGRRGRLSAGQTLRPFLPRVTGGHSRCSLPQGVELSGDRGDAVALQAPGVTESLQSRSVTDAGLR